MASDAQPPYKPRCGKDVWRKDVYENFSTCIRRPGHPDACEDARGKVRNNQRHHDRVILARDAQPSYKPQCGKNVYRKDVYENFTTCIRKPGHSDACMDSRGRVRNNQSRKKRRNESYS